MLRKPPACKGCPLADNMLGFCPDELVEGAETFILGQGPGWEEEAEGVPFTGPTGQKMNRRFLPLAGLERGTNVSIGNVLKCRWTREGVRTDDLPPEPILSQAVNHCTAAYLRIPKSVKLVIAQGQLAWDTCGGGGSIHSWRGYLAGQRALETCEEEVVSGK